ncbi:MULTISPECIES: aminomethyl-transferring glycine dehydrogenase subunit GcvPA [unclassified Candidatus Frackibacter]|jgi:glycine dehydrogenase subunit 1|uniref:aminomethyl-transferring glycine dehydrogenase subunit GcvPA n=1 Tax=unclassified Candidatus Frackibacter TaxID=2648818 RepID=UPI000881C28B|nr:MULTISPECIES: aminomethyl-transferring glycine dehydrogenase subunit GcvPA [unclassified Candidatus Frackibacter]SDC36841.1 glycine dehydrogenase (decarboxylating) alpha subunit [Candidatus Frackibacter sp. WG11]SEM63106.1 glycine dehydrogenase (decarboxylating) alpha subunit [Candidatus Frackibacter sp. WG12]SFL64579.1 glycine dehydrogenase (decarboxylating) alpha subunit [Candidatus Frackibacter sp. WG13]
MFPYLPHTKEEREELLAGIGIDSIDELFTDIPDEVKLERELDLGQPLSELEIKRRMEELSGKNQDLSEYTSFLGAGVYDHYIPSVVDHILLRSEFYTAYTPYQPEISQGYLQAIFEYQTMICELTGLDVANASMYDGASATAEAALMSTAVKRRRKEIVVSTTVSPEIREVLVTYCSAADLVLKEIDFNQGVTDHDKLKEVITEETASVIVQNPNFFGQLEDLAQLADLAHDVDALFVVVADPISLAILEAPGNLGADIVVGEGQGLGNPQSFGGPHFGFFATTKRNMRRIPGRVVGETVDDEGNRGFVLTLQTREQHIRRERATSNICSNQALNALAATVYLTLMGKQGLKEVAKQSLKKAHYAAERIAKLDGYELAFDGPFFKEFAIQTEESISEINQELLEDKIVGGHDLGNDYSALDNTMLLAVTEKRTKEEIDNLVEGLEGIK